MQKRHDWDHKTCHDASSSCILSNPIKRVTCHYNIMNHDISCDPNLVSSAIPSKFQNLLHNYAQCQLSGLDRTDLWPDKYINVTQYGNTVYVGMALVWPAL